MDSIQNKKEQTTEIYYNIDEPSKSLCYMKEWNAKCHLLYDQSIKSMGKAN